MNSKAPKLHVSSNFGVIIGNHSDIIDNNYIINNLKCFWFGKTKFESACLNDINNILKIKSSFVIR